MDTYSFLREFADSWGLLAMFLAFLGACLYAWARPKAVHDDAARAIFRHETPSEDGGGDAGGPGAAGGEGSRS